MKVINDKCRIKAEIITPLSIGIGSDNDWVNGLDYVVSGDMLYHLNLSKIAGLGVDMNVIASLFERKDTTGIAKVLGNRLSQASDFIMAKPSVSSSNPIKAMMRSQLKNCPIIAGSSLKGAIRSVLFKYLHNDDVVNNFGTMKDGTEFMRFIKVSDFEFESTGLVNTKIYNLCVDQDGEWQGGWKHRFDHTDTRFNPSGFNTTYECLMPKMTAFGYISSSKQQFNMISGHSELELKKQLFHNEEVPEASFIENLFYEINSHTYDYLEKEAKFFKKYPEGECSDRIKGSINYLMHLVNECINGGNSCVIKISAGAGFHSITGDWQYDDYVNTGVWNNGKHKYKSRKIAIHNDSFNLMGFVKLSIDD